MNNCLKKIIYFASFQLQIISLKKCAILYENQKLSFFLENSQEEIPNLKFLDINNLLKDEKGFALHYDGDGIFVSDTIDQSYIKKLEITKNPEESIVDFAKRFLDNVEMICNTEKDKLKL